MRRAGIALALLLGSLVSVWGCDVSDGDCRDREALNSDFVCRYRSEYRERVRIGVPVEEGDEPTSISTVRLYEFKLPAQATSAVIPLRLGKRDATYVSVGPVRDARLLDESGAELEGVFASAGCADADREKMFRLEWEGDRVAWLHLELDEGTETVLIQADDAGSVYLVCE